MIETAPPRADADPELRALGQALSLSQRFHLYLVWWEGDPGRAWVDSLRMQVESLRGEPVACRVIAAPHALIGHALEREALRAGVLAPLLAAAGGITVLDLSAARASDEEVWCWLFQRVNELRNDVVKHLEGELVLSGPRWMERALARHAPDLWSVRSGEYLPRWRAATSPVTPTADRVSTPRPRPREARAILVRRVDEARALMRDRPGDDNAVRLLASELEELAKDHLAWETLASAEEHAREAVMWRRSLVARAPEEAEAKHELCGALIVSGDVRRHRGELTGALAVYEETAQIMRGLVEADPSHPEWSRDLSVCLDRVGDVRWAKGNLDGAVGDYDASLALRRRLLSLDPTRAEWLHGLTVSLDRSAEVRRARGELSKAREAIDEGLRVARGLAQNDPDRLGLCHFLIQAGGIRAVQGELSDARSLYEEALGVCRARMRGGPADPVLRRCYGVCLEAIGDLCEAVGDLPGAREAYEETVVIRRELLGDDPARPERIRELGVALSRLGDLRHQMGDLIGAEEVYKEARSSLERALSVEPERPEWIRDLSALAERLGDLRTSHGDADGARVAYEESMELVQRLLARDQGRLDWRRDAMVSRVRLFASERSTRPEVATRHLQEARAIAQQLAARSDAPPQAHADLANLIALSADFDSR